MDRLAARQEFLVDFRGKLWKSKLVACYIGREKILRRLPVANQRDAVCKSPYSIYNLVSLNLPLISSVVDIADEKVLLLTVFGKLPELTLNGNNLDAQYVKFDQVIKLVIVLCR